MADEFWLSAVAAPPLLECFVPALSIFFQGFTSATICTPDHTSNPITTLSDCLSYSLRDILFSLGLYHGGYGGTAIDSGPGTPWPDSLVSLDRSIPTVNLYNLYSLCHYSSATETSTLSLSIWSTEYRFDNFLPIFRPLEIKIQMIIVTMEVGTTEILVNQSSQ